MPESTTRIARVQTFTTFGGVRNWTFVRVETTDGLHGWGEASTELWESTVAAAIDELGRRLIGLDALATEQVWQRANRHGFWRGGVVLGSAVAALDQALWDIKGKYFGVPVYKLLGGPSREWVETYRHVGIYDPDQLADAARQLVGEGVRTLKTGAWVADSTAPERERIRRASRRMETLRDAIGEDIDILIDNHGRARPDESIRLIDAIAPFAPRWIEEPIAPEAPELVTHVSEHARRAGISVALGERLFSRWEFRHVLERQLVDIVQPDICHAGGITELVKIAAYADVYRATVAPHNPGGPVSTAASAQVAMAIPNFAILELCLDAGLDRVATTRWSTHGDRLTVPDLPGLGVELDVDAILDVPAAAIGVPSSAFARDGSVADV